MAKVIGFLAVIIFISLAIKFGFMLLAFFATVSKLMAAITCATVAVGVIGGAWAVSRFCFKKN